MTTPRCPCNNCLMIPEHRGGFLVSYWCPHMETDGQVDLERHLRWQEANQVPDWLCKVRRAAVLAPPQSNNPTDSCNA